MNITLTSWEIACIEYALSDYQQKSLRDDLQMGSKSAYSKIVNFIKSAQSKLPYGEKECYSAELINKSELTFGNKRR